MSTIIDILTLNRKLFGWLLESPYSPGAGFAVSLGDKNPEMGAMDIHDMDSFEEFINRKISLKGKRFAYGGYGENRSFYKRSQIFLAGSSPRTIHLGIDLWCPAGTLVRIPLAGRIHGFRNNAGTGNYGPTIITRHRIDDHQFYMLFGHLSMECLTGLDTGSFLETGELIGSLGDRTVNGNWPPHLHFQIIGTLAGDNADYPGVSAPEDADKYLENCPDPGLIFNL